MDGTLDGTRLGYFALTVLLLICITHYRYDSLFPYDHSCHILHAMLDNHNVITTFHGFHSGDLWRVHPDIVEVLPCLT